MHGFSQAGFHSRLWRAGSSSVTTGGTNITFSLPLPSTDYSLEIRCYDGSGNNIDYTITNKATTGFTLTPAANGTAEYVALINI